MPMANLTSFLCPDAFGKRKAAQGLKSILLRAIIIIMSSNREARLQKLLNNKMGNLAGQDTEVDFDSLHKKKWDQLVKKISFDPPNESYYNKRELKPGFDFWRLLAKSPKSLKKLNTRIPHSFIMLGPNNYYHMFYSEEK